MSSKIILCTGGSRSGKSFFAEKLALSLEGQKVYVATATIYDEEMKERVDKHKARRGKEWHNLECHTGLGNQWQMMQEVGDVILIDCLTMWITNELMKFPDMDCVEYRENLRKIVMENIESLISQIRNSEKKTIIFVTNELGLGIIPSNAMARVFRDIVGEVNQLVAKASDEVYLSVSGITMEIKTKEIHIDG